MEVTPPESRKTAQGQDTQLDLGICSPEEIDSNSKPYINDDIDNVFYKLIKQDAFTRRKCRIESK